MKVKLLRRMFCVVMCVVILACNCTSAFGTELFESESNDTTEYYWVNSGGSGENAYVSVCWVNLNLPSVSSTGPTYNDAVIAIEDFWVNDTGGVVNQDEVTLYEYANMASGWVAHSTPSTTYWKEITKGWVNGVAALTYSYSTLGRRIHREEGVVYPSPYCGNIIAYSYIYYNPAPGNVTRIAPWATIAAHEIGHSLGFGHPTIAELSNSEDGALMRGDIIAFSYTSLKEFDVGAFDDKYG